LKEHAIVFCWWGAELKIEIKEIGKIQYDLVLLPYKSKKRSAWSLWRHSCPIWAAYQLPESTRNTSENLRKLQYWSRDRPSSYDVFFYHGHVSYEEYPSCIKLSIIIESRDLLCDTFILFPIFHVLYSNLISDILIIYNYKKDFKTKDTSFKFMIVDHNWNLYSDQIRIYLHSLQSYLCSGAEPACKIDGKKRVA
jgi:hypothetical protein